MSNVKPEFLPPAGEKVLCIWNAMSCVQPQIHKYTLLVKLVLSLLEAYPLCQIQGEVPLLPSMLYSLTYCMGLGARKPRR